MARTHFARRRLHHHCPHFGADPIAAFLDRLGSPPRFAQHPLRRARRVRSAVVGRDHGKPVELITETLQSGYAYEV